MSATARPQSIQRTFTDRHGQPICYVILFILQLFILFILQNQAKLGNLFVKNKVLKIAIVNDAVVTRRAFGNFRFLIYSRNKINYANRVVLNRAVLE